MSHYYALVALPPGFDGDVEETVAKLMAPYSEDLEVEMYHDPEYPDEGHMHNPRGFWDWWQIGGRWTGHLSEDYDPSLDPNNVETCIHCGGTGVRPDGLERFGAAWVEATGGCNGCGGVGAAVKWPTQWAKHGGDIRRWGDVRDLVLAEKRPYTALVGEAVAHGEIYVPTNPQSERFVGTGEVEPLLRSLSDDALVVIVDYHN